MTFGTLLTHHMNKWLTAGCFYLCSIWPSPVDWWEEVCPTWEWRVLWLLKCPSCLHVSDASLIHHPIRKFILDPGNSSLKKNISLSLSADLNLNSITPWEAVECPETNSKWTLSWEFLFFLILFFALWSLLSHFHQLSTVLQVPWRDVVIADGFSSFRLDMKQIQCLWASFSCQEVASGINSALSGSHAGCVLMAVF